MRVGWWQVNIVVAGVLPKLVFSLAQVPRPTDFNANDDPEAVAEKELLDMGDDVILPANPYNFPATAKNLMPVDRDGEDLFLSPELMRQEEERDFQHAASNALVKNQLDEGAIPQINMVPSPPVSDRGCCDCGCEPDDCCQCCADDSVSSGDQLAQMARVQAEHDALAAMREFGNQVEVAQQRLRKIGLGASLQTTTLDTPSSVDAALTEMEAVVKKKPAAVFLQLREIKGGRKSGNKAIATDSILDSKMNAVINVARDFASNRLGDSPLLSGFPDETETAFREIVDAVQARISAELKKEGG